MEDEVRAFLIGALREMNYDVSSVTGETGLGPAGLDLESLAIADLLMQMEDRFGVACTDDETGRLELMTLDEFARDVTGRMTAGSAAR